MKRPTAFDRIFSIAVRAAAVLAVAGLVVFLSARSLSPEGALTVTTDLVSPAPYLSSAKPPERLTAASPGDAALAGDEPVYFDLTPPPGFDSVTETVRFTNPSGTLLEMGALASSIDEQYDLRPADNRLLDSLSWTRVTSGRLTLLERNHGYASVDEFLARPPDGSEVAVYRAKVTPPFRLADYSPGPARETEISLRGRHRLYAYVKNEPLNVTFVVQDMNRQTGADPVIVTVYKEGSDEPYARTVLNDDGDTSDDQHSSPLRTVPVSVIDPPEGVYQIEFTASSDVFIRRIRTTQRKLVFADRLNIGDHVGYSDVVQPLTVYTDGLRVTARTSHPESLQTVTAGSAKLDVAEPQVRYSAKLPAGRQLTAVTVPKLDMLLETDGLFALSPDEYFDPLPLPIGWYTTAADLDARKIDYVLTGYEPPTAEAGVYSAQAVFDLDKLARTGDGAYRFLVVAPGLSETQGDLRLKSVSFTLTRKPLGWSDLWPRLTRTFSAGPAGQLILPDGRSYEESPE